MRAIKYLLKNFSLSSLCALSVLILASQLNAEINSPGSVKLSKLIAINPAEELDRSFFPSYLHSAYTKYQSGRHADCDNDLEKITLTAYSKSSEKFYLLRALCTKNPDPATQLNNLNEISKKLLADKASNSDVLYALSLAYAENGIFDQALQKLLDAKWFNNFSQVKLDRYYYALSRVQMSLNAYGEAHISAIEAKKYNLKDQKFNLLLIECKIILADKRSALLLIQDLKGYPEKIVDTYKIRALMINADPVFHKKDILEASELVKKLSVGCAENKDLAIPAIKSLLYTRNFELARQISDKAVSLEPADPILISLKEQAYKEM